MNSRIRGLILGATAAALAVSACSTSEDTASEAPSTLPFVGEKPVRPSTALVETMPAIQLTPEQERLTDFEAQWICDLQATAFDSAGAIEETRNEKLAEASISEDAYLAFHESLDNNRDLRDVILFKYQESCQ